MLEITSLKSPIAASIIIPGSKSFSNRALIMAALSSRKTILKGVSRCDDTASLILALKKLGVKIIDQKNNLIIYGNNGNFKTKKININIGPAGTTIRFLAALSCLVPGKIILDGNARMRERPIKELAEALKKLGAEIKYLKNPGCPPLKIIGGKIQGGNVEIKGNISSQYLTALLLIAPVLNNGLELKIKNKLTSRSYLEMTLQGLKDFGIKIENKNNIYKIKNTNYNPPKNYQIEGDATGAGYFWALAAITGSVIKTKNINPESLQGDLELLKILAQMGCEIIKSKNYIQVKGPKILKAININMENLPDSAQTLACAAAFAKGKTKIIGLKTLKIKETDRLLALKTELAKMQIKTKIGQDFIEIEGGNPQGAQIKTYGDHRMAMAFAVMGARVPNIKIEDPGVVTKSFPEFWEIFKKLKLIKNN